jgi:uncharacterized protein (TIGR02678 family)
VAESALPNELAEERSRAVRLLLGNPFLDVDADQDDFRAVARHRDWLTTWFESTCGWQLVVDVTGGYARLAKRGSRPDPSRGARRVRGAGHPFDRRRYELLCLVCAELASRAITTIGILAGDLASATSSSGGDRLDTTKQRDRAAFVDTLKHLADRGVVSFDGGDVDAYVGDEHANAIVTVNAARLHRLIASATAPSGIDVTTTAEAVDRLGAEPRYGTVPSEPASADEEQRLRWTRHSLARRILDDPVVHFDELSTAERDYLANPSGRRWIRDRVAEAGFDLEERAEGVLAVDPDVVATDVVFPGSGGTVKQMALLLIDRFVMDGTLRERTPDELTDRVRALLCLHRGWAKEYRDPDGPRRLAEAAVDLLQQLRLVVRREGLEGRIRPRPPIARYAAGPANSGQPTLMEA